MSGLRDFSGLPALGWSDFFAASLSSLPLELTPARVAVARRGHYQLLDAGGPFDAEIAGRLRHEIVDALGWPAVGDWVATRRAARGAALVEQVLPRRTALVRGRGARKRDAPTGEAQLLVANVDLVGVVTSMNQDWNPRRLERYLALVQASGAEAMVVLTKRDLATDPAALEEEARALAPGAIVVSVSVKRGEGIDAVRAQIHGGRTLAFVGSSGVGKSTLVNSLLGRDARATGEIRESDGRGRHVTTHRELLTLPGGVLVDTPGLRELALWASDEEPEATAFDDIDALAASCRFRDCAHEKEPGCAVVGAVLGGTLEDARLESYRQLGREIVQQRARADARAESESKRAVKPVERSLRGRGKR